MVASMPPVLPSAPTPASLSPSAPQIDDLARVFNSAIVSTRVETARDFTTELFSLVESPAYRAILGSVRQLARAENLSDREAAETLIQTFRKMDGLWENY